MHNSSASITPIEFKEFYDLTAEGLSVQPLSCDFVMKEFKKADYNNKGFITQKQLSNYIVQFYQCICKIITSVKNKSKHSLLFSEFPFKFNLRYTNIFDNNPIEIYPEKMMRENLSQSFFNPTVTKQSLVHS